MFEGLTVKYLEKEWTCYPALHFGMGTARHIDKDRPLSELERKLYGYKQIHGRDESAIYTNQRLESPIKCTYAQTGQKAVVLTDRYDTPLLDMVYGGRELPRLHDMICNSYSPLKTYDLYLCFVFLTSIAKFFQLSIFSESSSIKNISTLSEYAVLCGITGEEMRGHMGEGIDRLADSLSVSPEDALGALESNYDGHHPTWLSPDIHNPFSLLNTLVDSKSDSYWFGSDMSTYLVRMLDKYHVEPQQIGAREVLMELFNASTERIVDITPLFYQSDYITIKGHSSLTNLYILSIPNREARMGLTKSLLPSCLHQYIAGRLITVALLFEAIVGERMNDALCLLQTFLSTILQRGNTNYEGHYQSLPYTIFSLLGVCVDAEARTPKGRVDMVMRILATLYVVGLRLNKTADMALEQISLYDCPERSVLCGLPIIKVKTSFDNR